MRGPYRYLMSWRYSTGWICPRPHSEAIQWVEKAAQKLSVPCFLYTGSADTDLGQTQDCARRVAHATCMVLPCLTHGGAFDRADLVLPSALDFLQRNARRTTGGDFARTS